MFAVIRNIKKHKTAMLGMAVAAIIFGGTQNAISNESQQTFSDNAWDSELLEMISYGPRILPADFDTGLNTPPENDSDDTRQELKFLVSLQDQRTTDVLNKIHMEHVQPKSLDVYEAEGLFQSDVMAHTQRFFEETERDLAYFIIRDKKKFARVRPSTLNADIQTVVENPAHPAYPSGHAAQSYFVGYTLGQLDTAKMDAYTRLSHDIAHRREIAGLHYPSDSQAGFLLAKNVFNGLMQNPEAKALYEEAQKEFKVN